MHVPEVKIDRSTVCLCLCLIMQVLHLLRREEKVTKAHGHTRLLAKNYKCLLLMCERHPAHSKVLNLHQTNTYPVPYMYFLLRTRHLLPNACDYVIVV